MKRRKGINVPFSQGFVVLAACITSCQPAPTNEVADLQKQIGALTQQIEAMRTDIEALQEQEVETLQIEQALESIEDEIEVFRTQLGRHKTPTQRVEPQTKPRASVPAQSVTKSPPLETEIVKSRPRPGPSMEAGSQVHDINCSAVWRLIGKGETAREIASSMGVPILAVQKCDAKIGKR